MRRRSTRRPRKTWGKVLYYWWRGVNPWDWVYLILLLVFTALASCLVAEIQLVPPK